MTTLFVPLRHSVQRILAVIAMTLSFFSPHHSLLLCNLGYAKRRSIFDDGNELPALNKTPLPITPL